MGPMMETMIGVEGRSVFRQSPDVVCRQVGAESILVPIRNNVGNLDYIYTLSPVAARVWALLDGTRSVDTIIAAICDEYDVTRETASADVNELLTDLDQVSLVSRVNG